MRIAMPNTWVFFFAALPAMALGGACGDDTTTTTSSGTSDDGDGGSTGTGDGGALVGSSSSGATVTATVSTTTTSTATGTSTGDGGAAGTGGGGGSSDGGGGGGGGAPDLCGNGVIEDEEPCDGPALGGETCESRGFVAGDLACNATCTGFDATACETCGDDVVQDGDDCDGNDFAGDDCTDHGFDGGTLGCNADCTFDTAQCIDFTCGDGVRNGNEACEGDDLASNACDDVGFVLGGTLACTDTCQFDISGCNSCGDDLVNGTDQCDGDALGDATCANIGQGFTGGSLACADGCVFDTSGCNDWTQPVAAGQVVITEFMNNPEAVDDGLGEWLELYNPSSTDGYQLEGCLVIGPNANNDRFTIGSTLTLPPGGYVTLAKSASAGFAADYVYGGTFVLGNSGTDGITLHCSAVDVDTLAYGTGSGFPSPAAGLSFSLDPGSEDANELGSNWCAATMTSANFTSGDLGTPGFPNPDCQGGGTTSSNTTTTTTTTGGAEPVTIDFCRLQAPLLIDEDQGTTVDIFGRVYVAGLTDLDTSGNDPSSVLVGEVGFGPNGSDPATQTSAWSWVGATPNAGYGVGSPDFEANNDEYVGSFAVPGHWGSPYDFAVRFSGDGGATWTYCDADGSTNGYATAQAGDMTSNFVAGGIFISQYTEGTSSNKAIEIFNASDAAVATNTCRLQSFTNGSSVGNTPLALVAPLDNLTLDPGETFVVCNQNESELIDSLCDMRTGNTNMTFNGNDAIQLVCGGTTRDVFGQIGFDPGNASNPMTGWPTGTVDAVLVRNCDILAGDADGSNAFTTATEWTRTVYSEAAANGTLDQHLAVCLE